ncbi:hypothetical protein MtrunA17_Chr7g0253811 [Medicago truncatula]|uniref:Uncharacterized protein n=1 Tax=Medicago truncatula TaxID=3880 RepID=G7L0J1_MEDTR|nr:hypothetical protein MTR_7g086320 [Medicago truncatula]RHN47513.1 hypothetical protein MtrunA17_Chr7g0253811 [Medicago truncatula]
MASLILLFSELVRNHEWNATALLAAYPPSSSTSSCASAAERKSLKDEEALKDDESVLESRVCVDFVWP